MIGCQENDLKGKGREGSGNGIIWRLNFEDFGKWSTVYLSYLQGGLSLTIKHEIHFIKHT